MKNNNKIRLLIGQFLSLSILLTHLSTAKAIVDIDSHHDYSPTISSSLGVQVDSFRKRYKTNDLSYFYMQFKDNANDVLNELKSVLKDKSIDRGIDQLVLNEFENIKEVFSERKLKPSENTYWAPPQELIVEYQRRTPRSYNIEVSADNNQKIYTHEMRFEFWLNYQKVDEVLKPHNKYPRAVLSGRIYLECQKKFESCRVVNLTFDEAGIRWEQIPGTRDGGNSSSGGGN